LLERVFVYTEDSRTPEIDYNKSTLNPNNLSNSIISWLWAIIYKLSFAQMAISCPSVKRRNLRQEFQVIW